MFRAEGGRKEKKSGKIIEKVLERKRAMESDVVTNHSFTIQINIIQSEDN